MGAQGPPIVEPGPALPSPTPSFPLGWRVNFLTRFRATKGRGPWRGRESFCPGPRSVHMGRPLVCAQQSPAPQGRSAVWGEISCGSSAPQPFPPSRQERAPVQTRTQRSSGRMDRGPPLLPGPVSPSCGSRKKGCRIHREGPGRPRGQLPCRSCAEWPPSGRRSLQLPHVCAVHT